MGSCCQLFTHLSSPHLFCHFCPSSDTEGLYQLGVPRCPPQSSIEGLEDIEVVFWFYCLYSSAARGVLKCSVLYLYPSSSYSSCYFHLLFVPRASISVFLSIPMWTPLLHRENAKHTCCCWWCTGATSWTRPAGTQVQRAATWPPWPPCWRRWHEPTSRRPANMWWSNWCRVQLCVPKPSPWCPSKCSCHGGQSHWLYSHMYPMGLSSVLCGDKFSGEN